MIERIRNGLFSFAGISILLAVAGFLSSLVTMFVDVSATVPMRVLLFVTYIALSLVVILLKVIYDLNQSKSAPFPFEKPIGSLPKEGIFVIRRNENFVNSIVVGCYQLVDEIERLAYLGVVHHVQDTMVQIKVTRKHDAPDVFPSGVADLSRIVIRPVVPTAAIAAF